MDLIESYKTLKSGGEGLYREKGSKFIAYAVKCESVEEVEAFLEETRKKYHDARHVCYAYRLGPDGGTFRANDDGEPSHSAGTPILNEMKSAEVTDAAVAVVRYFGGTKLGVSGLIHAYGTSAKDAIADAGIRVIHITQPLEIRFPYELTSEINKIMHHNQIQPVESEFLADCRLVFEIPVGMYEQVYSIFDKLGVIEEE